MEESEGFWGYAWRYPFENNDFTNISSGYKKSTRPDHYAIDIIGRTLSIHGTPILSPMTCTVVVSETGNVHGGNFVVAEYDSFWLGTGKKLRAAFLHMAYPPTLAVGDAIRKDDVIGYVGNTGDSYGSHLHL